MDLKSLLNTNNRQVQALTPILGSRLPFYTTSDTFSTSSKFDQEEYHNPDEEFDVGDAAENGNNDSNEDPASSEYRRCIWCHKKDIKSRLKRGVTFVVGRPRAGWEEAHLPLCYTCCGCYEQRRKGRNLDHKMETLKAQYQAFDTFGVQYYEIRKKRYGGRWEEWLGTASEVWIELYHSYHIEKSFAGLKASPVLDLDERTIRKRIKRRRESTDEEVVVDDSDDAEAELQVRRPEYGSGSTRSPERAGMHSSMRTAYEKALHYLVAETLTEMSGASALSPVHPSTRSKLIVTAATAITKSGLCTPTPAGPSSSSPGRGHDLRGCGSSSGAEGGGSPGGGSDFSTPRKVKAATNKKLKKRQMHMEPGRDRVKRHKRQSKLEYQHDTVEAFNPQDIGHEDEDEDEDEHEDEGEGEDVYGMRKGNDTILELGDCTGDAERMHGLSERRRRDNGCRRDIKRVRRSVSTPSSSSLSSPS